MLSKKPRVVIIGAGMAGLTAARRLVQRGDSSFDLILLEASSDTGGRIRTSEIGGNRVELGATWIHGMEGSPLYQIAQDIGATRFTKPFERQDGFPTAAVVKAEGGLDIPLSIVSPITDLYKRLLDQIRCKESSESLQTPLSIGAFVAKGLDNFFCQQSSCHSENALFDWVATDEGLDWSDPTSSWTMKSLQEALFAMNEYKERVETSANTLYDLDLRTEKEYKDYPGEHVTIPGGYISIVNEIASALPESLIQFGKKVEKIVWNRPSPRSSQPVAIHCSDGSTYEADHVIVTVSLGVLKAGVTQESSYAWDNLEGRHVCRSVDELFANSSDATSSLFEPPLPASKIEAISRLGYGLVNKVFLQLNTNTLAPSQVRRLNAHLQLVYKGHKGSNAGAIPRWMRKTFSLCPIYKGSSVLLCWFAGSEAVELESLCDEEIMAGVAQALASFGIVGRSSNVKRRKHHGFLAESEYSSCSDSEDSRLSSETCPSSTSSSDSEETAEEDERDFGPSEVDYSTIFSGLLRSSWGTDPLFRGSYSFVATGASGDDIEVLAAPLPASAGDCACNAAVDACNAVHEVSVARDGASATPIHVSRSGDGEIVDLEPLSTKGSQEAPLQLLFAGEATVRTLYSTTHGAHLSGLREADRLLNHYAFAA